MIEIILNCSLAAKQCDECARSINPSQLQLVFFFVDDDHRCTLNDLNKQVEGRAFPINNSTASSDDLVTFAVNFRKIVFAIIELGLTKAFTQQNMVSLFLFRLIRFFVHRVGYMLPFIKINCKEQAATIQFG